jgi:hypothetical protein
VIVDLPWPLRVRTCLLDRAFGNDRLRRTPDTDRGFLNWLVNGSRA